MVFEHSGGRDFDLPRHSHYSGVIPMVFEHSVEGPTKKSRLIASDCDEGPTNESRLIASDCDKGPTMESRLIASDCV